MTNCNFNLNYFFYLKWLFHLILFNHISVHLILLISFNVTLFYFILLYSYLFYSISFDIIFSNSRLPSFLMNCGICTNRKWNYWLVCILPLVFVSCSQTLVEVRHPLFFLDLFSFYLIQSNWNKFYSIWFNLILSCFSIIFYVIFQNLLLCYFVSFSFPSFLWKCFVTCFLI